MLPGVHNKSGASNVSMKHVVYTSAYMNAHRRASWEARLILASCTVI